MQDADVRALLPDDTRNKKCFCQKLYGNDIPVFHYKETDSTNEAAKRLLKNGSCKQALLYADSQTNGKGRRGRTFYSPPEEGVYMSLLFTPEEALENVISVTTATAVIVAEAIEKLTGQTVAIKWVNDLYVRERKVCGILAEAILPQNAGEQTAIIVGIGINVSNQAFPKELEGIAGSLNMPRQDRQLREDLIAEITSGFIQYLENMKEKTYLLRYRERSMVLGKRILCHEGNEQYPALALDIDEDGGLIVALENGERRCLHSGEITIRVKSAEELSAGKETEDNK